MVSKLESGPRDTVEWGRKWLVDVILKKVILIRLSGAFDTETSGFATGAIDVKVDGCVLEKKSFFKVLGLYFCSKLDWGFCIISVDKIAFKKIGGVIRSMKFLAPEVAFYLYKSTIRPCMEHCFHVRAGAPNCYSEMFDKQQRRVCRTVFPSLAASFEPLAHRQNITSLSLSYRYYFVRCSSELAELVPLPYSRGRSTRYSDRLHDFCVFIARCYKGVNSLLPRLWNAFF